MQKNTSKIHLPFLFGLFPLFLILYEFCTNMSNDMYLPALPLIGKEFSTSINFVQLTIAAWFAGNASVQLVVGPLSDHYGRRPILFGGGLLFLISTLGCALAPSLSFLIVARFIQGMGVCCMMVAGYASIQDLYDDQKAIHVLAWMGSAAIIAPAIGPILGAMVLVFGDWRGIFYILFFLAIISLVCLGVSMPESASHYSKQQRQKPETLLQIYRKILSNSSFMISAASFALLYGGIIGWITASPFLLIEYFKLTPTQFGWLQIPVFGSYIIGAQLVKPLMKKTRASPLVQLGLTISLLSGILLILFSILAEKNLLSFILPLSGYSLGFGLASPPLTRLTLNFVGEKKGSAMAIFYLLMMGVGTLVSVILSIFNESPITMSVVIGASILFSYILNMGRQKRIRKRKA